MPSAPVKKAASRKTTKRHQPYDSSKRSKAHSASTSIQFTSNASSSSSHSSASSSTAKTLYKTSAPPLQATRPTKPLRSIREFAEKIVRKEYPYFTPRNDWELLYLSNARYSGTVAGLYERLDNLLALEIQDTGTYEDVVNDAKETLDELLDITGVKPNPGDPQVFVHRLPGSKYSIRLFPGNAANQDYCLDFVLTSTGEPINSPFKFDLFCMPNPDAPMGSAPIMRMRPLECSFGIPEHKIDPGEEKFLLHDGQHCLLRRPGHRDVRFTVPIRRRPKPETPPVDADVLQFPQYID